VLHRTVSLRAAFAAPLVVLACLLLAAGGGGGPAAVSPAAARGGPNRAVVIVDGGGGARAQCVLFEEPSISGLEALRRAGFNPAVRGYGGEGGFVCGIDGTGCPTDDSCTTCQAPSYWAYFRSSGGGFSYSSAGAGGAQVTDGDVEGWRWGTGSAPAHRTVDSVCGPEAPPATAPPTAPPSGGGSGGGGSSAGPVAPSVPAAGAADPGDPDASTTTVLGETTTTTEPGPGEDGKVTVELPSGDTGGRGTEQADGSVAIADEDGQGGSLAGSIALTAGALGGLAALVWWARHRRQAAGGSTVDGQPVELDPIDPDEGPGSL